MWPPYPIQDLWELPRKILKILSKMLGPLSPLYSCGLSHKHNIVLLEAALQLFSIQNSAASTSASDLVLKCQADLSVFRGVQALLPSMHPAFCVTLKPWDPIFLFLYSLSARISSCSSSSRIGLHHAPESSGSLI